MDSELIQKEGHLAARKRRVAELEISMRGDLRAVRTALDPYAPLAELPCEEAMSQAIDLAKKQVELKRLLVEIADIEKALKP